MPTYQYRCTECGHDLEAVQKFTDAPLTECPNCHGHLRKVFSAVGVVFKGSGFYKTDSRGSSSSTVPAGEKKSDHHAPAAKAETPKSDGAKAEAPKPAAKPERAAS